MERAMPPSHYQERERETNGTSWGWEGRKVTMVILPFFLAIGRPDLLFHLKIYHDHLHSSLPRKGGKWPRPSSSRWSSSSSPR
jgi:hypothetical protein